MADDIRIQFKFEVEKYLRNWNRLGKDQIPFALAATLTKVAARAQKRVRAQLPRRFTIRSKWLSKGIQMRKAKKRDYPDIEAIIGTKDAFMVDQETGEDRGPVSGTFRAIPTRRVKRTASGRVSKPQTPRRLLSKKRNPAFFGDRTIKLRDTKKTKHRAPTMYLLRRRVSMRARFGFRETVTDTAARTLQPEFNRQLLRAIRSSF